ncbi:MAG TPA: hypothetical protein VNX23_02610 [Bradyrhizobium sp.]|jgi:hypothetical protein|uniref:hypothetical protein n=1 Tax=Bradyrhizobium sp. TaxID=376 RepID=UPI002CCF10CF|nr:hypothetical protein [Bradyrhizobium sp.]HJY92003.1 hypothetical protein [Candidatus Acidoferrum sp.]HXB76296.1 hypothetical protein [Bradyrhizobium sp.]
MRKARFSMLSWARSDNEGPEGHQARVADFFEHGQGVERRFVLMAKQCLLFPDLTEWERDFLESLIARPPDRLSTRQAEVLFEIRDANELISNVDGNIKVSTLIRRAYEARLELDEGDEEWIVAIWNRGTTSLRRRHIGRLKRCCVQLGELESHVA